MAEIVERAGKGNLAARATVVRLREKFGEAIAAVINSLDPKAGMISGGGNIGELYTDAARWDASRHLFNAEARTECLRPKLGDSAGVFGVALLSL